MPGGAYHFVWIPTHSRDILVGDVAEYAKEVFSGLNKDAGRHRWRFCPTTSMRRASTRDGLRHEGDCRRVDEAAWRGLSVDGELSLVELSHRYPEVPGFFG